MSPRLPVATDTETERGIRCPRCSARTRVVDTVHKPERRTRRRHECPACGARFSTDERIDTSSIAS